MSGKRCYMRYGNQGQLYRVCAGPPPATSKPPAIFTPLITPVAFVKKLASKNKKIKSYDDLSSSQRQNYHRLAQAQSREKRRENIEMNNEQYSIFLEQRRMDAHIERVEEKIERKQEKEEKRIKRNMEEKGILANTPEEIKEYFNKKVKEDLSKLDSQKVRDEFFESKKDNAEDIFKKRMREDDDDKVNIIASQRRKDIDLNTTISIPNIGGEHSISSIFSKLGFNKNVAILSADRGEVIKNLRKIGEVIVKVNPKLKGKVLSLDNLNTFIEKNAKFKSQLKPFFEVSDKIRASAIKSYNKEQEDFKNKQIKEIKERYKTFLINEEKRIRDVNDTKMKQAKNKLVVAEKDFREKGLSRKWIKKNVNIVFDKNLSGDFKVGDIGDLLNIKKNLEKVDKLDEKLEVLQTDYLKGKGKRAKKTKQLTEKQKVAQAKKDAKEMLKVQKALNKINKGKK